MRSPECLGVLVDDVAYAEAGAGIDPVAAQADRLLANDPDTDLILIQVMDNDLTCPTSYPAEPRTGASLRARPQISRC